MLLCDHGRPCPAPRDNAEAQWAYEDAMQSVGKRHCDCCSEWLHEDDFDGDLCGECRAWWGVEDDPYRARRPVIEFSTRAAADPRQEDE